MSWRPAIAAVVVLSAGWSCLAQPDPIARQKLEQSIEALKGLKSFSYDLKFSSEGGFGLDQRAQTHVKMLRPEANPEKWMIHWSGMVKPGGDEEGELLCSLDQSTGTMVWVDHKKREWIKRPERDFKTGEMDRRAFAWVGDLADAGRLKELVEAQDMAMEAAETLDGVECDVILIKPDRGTPRRWAIGKEDHLPRRVDWVFDGSGMSGRWRFDMSGVTANPPLTVADFEIPAPAGYNKIEPPPPPVYTPPPPGATTSTAAPRGDAGGAPAVRVRSIGAGVGDLAPDFELVQGDVEGTGKEERLRLSSLKGSVVVLDFWGSWSPKSKTAGPEMKALVEKFTGQPVRVLGMTLRERDKAKPIAFMKDNGYPWTILLQADDTAKHYKVRVYPTYFVIGPEGEIVHIESGFEKDKTMKAITEAVEKALAAAPAPAPATPATPAVTDPAGGGDNSGG